MLRLALVLILTALWNSAVAQDERPAQLPPMEEEAALRTAEVVGALLYRHDQAAAVATDALAKVRGFKRNRNLEGWITEAQGDSISVTFIGRENGEPLAALYRVRVDASGQVEGAPAALKPAEPLTEFESAAAQARSLALRSPFQPCSEKYNSVVIPNNSSSDEWVVYLLPGTTNRNVVPIGGSYRIDVNIRTGTAMVHPYTKTCIQLQNDPRAVGLAITHLLHSVPTDVHVFWSIWAKKPLYIATPPHGTVWSIEGQKIRLVERREEG